MVHIEKPIIADRVKRLIEDKMGIRVEELSETDDLYSDLGMDSLDVIELEVELGKEYSIEIEDEDLEKWRKIGDIVEYLDGVVNA